MRKALICASVLSMLISSTAIASEMDLSEMSLDELVTLKNSVMEEIDSRNSLMDTETETEDMAKDYIPSEGLEFESNGDGTCSITGMGTCTDTELVIPNQNPEGDTVTLIEENAFMSLENVESVTLIDATYEIDKYAFQYGDFVELNIIGGSPTIKKSAFSTCEDLASITFSDSTITMEENAFFGCGDDADVKIIDSTVTVGDYAFQYGEILNLSIYNSDVAIEKSAFSTCENLTSIVFLDSTITTEENAFFGCGDVGTIEITNCTVILGKYAFQYSSIGSITITGSKAEIGEYCFSNCEDLSEVVMDCESIFLDESAFSSCGDLASVSLCLNEKKDNTIEIEDGVFNYCENLEMFSIGSGDVKIGKNVFSGCGEDLSIEIDGKLYIKKDLEDGLNL